MQTCYLKSMPLVLFRYRRISQQRTKEFDSLSCKRFVFDQLPMALLYRTELRSQTEERFPEKGMPFFPILLSRFEWNVIRITIRSNLRDFSFSMEFFSTRRDDIFINSIFPISDLLSRSRSLKLFERTVRIGKRVRYYPRLKRHLFRTIMGRDQHGEGIGGGDNLHA